MKTLETARRLNGMSAAKLRRARRLFVHMNFDNLMDFPDAWAIFPRKMRERGLYACSASDLDIRFSIARKLFKAHKEANPGQWEESWGWNRWLDQHDWIWWSNRNRPKGTWKPWLNST